MTDVLWAFVIMIGIASIMGTLGVIAFKAADEGYKEQRAQHEKEREPKRLI